MATTSKGTPYVEAADLVSGYPTVSLNLAEHIDDNVAYNAATINAQTGTTYTFVLADATEGKLVTATNAASQTYTVPPESSVAWPTGSVLRILNQGAGTVTVAAGSGVTINGTPLTLAQYKGAAIQKTGTDTWTFIPFSGGVGSAVISSPAATGSYSSGGTTYNYYTFTASGPLTVDTAGFADVLVVGGGGSGGRRADATTAQGGGGAGGYYEDTIYLNAGSLTITVGAGGAEPGDTSRGNIGTASALGKLAAVGGGGGGHNSSVGIYGGSAGGSGNGYTGSATALSVQGNSGGGGSVSVGNSHGAGGGGGAGASGGTGTTSVGGNGGAGIASSITGTSVTRGGGGGGQRRDGSAGAGGAGGGGAGGTTGGATAGTANTGGGGGGGATSSGAGGSGIVIVRVAA